MLLENGADPEVLNNEGLNPSDVTDDIDVKASLEPSTIVKEEPILSVSPPPSSNFVNLQFPKPIQSMVTSNLTKSNKKEKIKILKIRLGQSNDPDFIEIDLPEPKWTYECLLEEMMNEFELTKEQGRSVERIRKLPNTKIRRDIEIQRLENYAELELILQ